MYGSSGPATCRRAEKKLKKRQRELSRKEKDSNNRDKARIDLARAHAQVADARRNFHHHWSHKLTRENQAVFVETLNVRRMARGRLAKSVRDAGWAQFVSFLEYKATRRGRTFIKVARDFPSSQICSACGHRDGKKPLNKHPDLDVPRARLSHRPRPRLERRQEHPTRGTPHPRGTSTIHP